ncbi:hypothetical protein [Paraburkholderia tropica]|uniref:hypothetical protein n=1 Tax=Paraburkholderia tropica TaxID=92647 RepID=UPI002AB02C3A|nr:hypothetical protein [Paraburkholderia tropica]
MANEEALDGQWSQKQISVWMTRRRMEKLRALAASLPRAATPIDALDKALELATTPLFVPASEIDAARETREAGAETIAAIGRLEARLLAALAASDKNAAQSVRQIHHRVERVHEIAEDMRAMMASAANDDGLDEGADAQGRGAGAIPIGDWLRATAKALGEPAPRSLLARAAWRSKTRATETFVSMDFLCQLVAVDNTRAQNAPPPILIRIDLIEAQSPLSRLDSFNAICFSCALSPSGSWLVEAHSLEKQGKLGAVVGSFAT